MRLRLLLILASATALTVAAPPAVAAAGDAPRAKSASGAAGARRAPTASASRGNGAAPYRPRELVVRYGGASAASAGTVPRTRIVRVARGRSVAAAARGWRERPGVLSATPNYVAHISGWQPDDPGTANVLGGWQQLQWNFMPETGVNAPDAWNHMFAVGRPGGRGVTIAVLDTGVAYSNRGRYRRSPDLPARRFVRGWDFVGADRYPNDDNGHGTHVASTIAEGTGNGVGLTGLAYGVRIMPVKVLDRRGEGDSARIAAGIRWASNHGAQIINLSFEFPEEITRAQIPNILDALRHARRKGVLVVGASGNAAAAAVAYPARSSDVLSVGATTQHGCLADYSNEGWDLDLVAPGGGADAAFEGDPLCRPNDPPGLDIFQMTFTSSVRRFGYPDGYIGTSMAAPHASATAALVIASGLLGPDPSPSAIERRLELTAVDLGAPGKDPHYGWGRLDAARATDPAIPVT